MEISRYDTNAFAAELVAAEENVTVGTTLLEENARVRCQMPRPASQT